MLAVVGLAAAIVAYLVAFQAVPHLLAGIGTIAMLVLWRVILLVVLAACGFPRTFVLDPMAVE